MANLPPEVLRLIFPLLVTRDQLECMTVCRQWYDNIYTPSLFRVIVIHSPDKLDQLIEAVQRNSILGEKVERLTLPWIIDSNYDETIFFRLFPNLREFTLLSSDDEQVKLIEPRQNHPWCRNMETLIQANSDYQAKSLLCSGTCKNLTKIEVNGFGTVSGLVELLTNAPALKELEMLNYTVALQDLESLHEKAPQLKSLSTFGVFLERSSFPLRIKSATSLKDFKWLGGDFDTLQDYLQLLEYIHKKYTELEAFEIESATLEDDNGIEDVNENDIIIRNNFQALYTTAMTSLFKTRGSQLKTLSFAVNSLRDPTPYCDWRILDEFGCRIQTLTLAGHLSISEFEKLSRSNQAHFIETLKIRWNESARDTKLDPKWFSYFTALTDLELTMYRKNDNIWSINTNDLMDILKGISLKTLRLHNMRLRPGNTNETQVYPLIKELHLSNVKFDKDADLCIARMFPNLKRLTLRDCFQDGDLLMLPNIHLFYLRILNTARGDSYPVLVITMENRQQRLYNTKSVTWDYMDFVNSPLENTLSLPYVSSTSLYKSKIVPKITIQCGSLYHFVMVNVK